MVQAYVEIEAKYFIVENADFEQYSMTERKKTTKETFVTSYLVFNWSILNNDHVLFLECDKPCENQVRYVCASDGRTYLNECELNNAICKSDRKLIKLYEGLCSGMTMAYEFIQFWVEFLFKSKLSNFLLKYNWFQ